MIHVLSNDISGLYSVALKTHQVTAYFVDGNALEIYDFAKNDPIYENVIESYIKNNVYKDDQNEMRYVTEFAHVCKTLEKQINFTFHYRVSMDNEIHYYNLKYIRNGVNYDSIFFLFECEDNQVNDRKLQHILNTDPLTGLYRKQAFFQHCKELLEENPEDEFDIVLVDIKNFRLLNNIYGMDKGNELLKALAKHLVDSHKNDLWGRFSGDQIIGMASAKNRYTQEWIEEFTEEFNKTSPVPDVVIKWGIYHNVDKSLSIERMCNRAHIALKSIKQNFSQLSACFDGEIGKQHYHAQLYETCFPSAINNKEFIVWYQPKYDPYEKKVVGAEALVRWFRDGKIIPTGEFLSVFEEDGLIRKLDEYVFQSVCEFQHRRQKKGQRLIPISINLSRVSMLHSDAAGRYSSIAAEYGVDPAYLPIEITESAEIECSDIRILVEEFRKLGFPLHMDDFGSGNSSLHCLNVLQFDVLKIDKGLVDFIGEENGESILQHVILMANEINLKIVAEGVENEQQLEFLMNKGCDLIQGYYFSKPLSEEEFEELLKEPLKETDVLLKEKVETTKSKNETLSKQLRKQEEVMKSVLLSVTQNQRLGTIEMSPDILQKSRIGLWAFEMDEGMAPRMYIDDTMRELMGLKEQLPPEETYNTWYTRIDKNHYDEINATLEEMIAGAHAEVQYPWNHPDGRIRSIRCGGIRNYAYKNGIRIEGCHQDVTEMMHFQKKGATELLAALSSNIFTLYFVDPENGEYEFWSYGEDDVSGVLSEQKRENFYHDAIREISKVVISEDQEIVLKSISKENFMIIIETGETQEYEVRWNTSKDKKFIWIKQKLIRYKDANGSYKIVVGFENITEKKEREEQTNLLIKHSNTDEQTGFLNHRAYNEALAAYEEKAIEEDAVFISLDVNGLKVTNDTLGHAAGDELISGATKCMRQCFGSYGKLFRTGGDEFMAIIFADESKLEELKEEFRKVISVYWAAGR